MRGKRKPPQPTTMTNHAAQPAAQCDDCNHVWFLRGERIGRCPSCKRLGASHRVNVTVEKAAA
jgi:hypothetical protein